MSNIRISATNSLLQREEGKDDATKPAVIAIAITATVLVVALIAGGLFWFLRRRHRRRHSGHGHVDSVDGDAHILRERTSKIPLMRQENTSNIPEDRESPAPRYDDDVSLDPPNLHRSMSGSTTRSLPPAYASIVHSSPDPRSRDVTSIGPLLVRSDRPVSSTGGSSGLRPLMLVDSQQGHSANDGRSDGNHDPQPASSDSVGSNSGLAAESQMPAGRPRSASRFREEDLDM
ncbi:hypothetical protein H2198_007319 [Neophaeococcomyces mojaviensis]|uniref:Uncharacterized protein n=1 Tax=Neophaeococcomyces mojaviensis TaxID=3383035 RepID=A0ACC3A0Y5_9EURO|nr:hypothetical protein H2198_007319 [Knufia sp. JES_112]